MCGIIAKFRRQGPVESEGFRRQLDTMVHRGPDDSGTWFSPDRRLALGSRRLAIQDLSPLGHMPMSIADGRVVTVLNGEIYNFQALRRELETLGYRFQSHSDTEVFLNAYLEWGTACLDRLEGMFAFALFDGREGGPGTVFLARDRVGEKPLYFRHHEGGWEAASELKALMADPAFPRRLDPAALRAYLERGYVPGAQCILAGVGKLLPAHAMVIDLATNTLRTWRYWQLPPPSDEEGDPEELEAELEARLAASVRDRLIADVPVGILLSGGVDSSLVTALAARSSPQPVRTFTIVFPGQASHDEGPFARAVARHFGTIHEELPGEPPAANLLFDLARLYDEPFGDSSLVPTFQVSRLTRRQVTVGLGGDGGDELFGGYTYYREALRRETTIARLPTAVKAGTGFLADHLPAGLPGRNLLAAWVRRPGLGATTGNFFDGAQHRSILAPALHDRGETLGCPAPGRSGTAPTPAEEHLSGVVDALTRNDFTTYLPDDILVKVDRASMGVSLEMRAPFLDRHLIEFAFGKVTHRLKVGSDQQKILPRRLARRLLPPDLDLDRKQGFALPLTAWFADAWKDVIREVLAEASPEVFSRAGLHRLYARQRAGFSNTSRLFAVTMFELWRRAYGVTL